MACKAWCISWEEPRGQFCGAGAGGALAGFGGTAAGVALEDGGDRAETGRGGAVLSADIRENHALGKLGRPRRSGDVMPERRASTSAWARLSVMVSRRVTA